jgi:hypothetical protein
MLNGKIRLFDAHNNENYEKHDKGKTTYSPSRQ